MIFHTRGTTARLRRSARPARHLVRGRPIRLAGSLAELIAPTAQKVMGGKACLALVLALIQSRRPPNQPDGGPGWCWQTRSAGYGIATSSARARGHRPGVPETQFSRGTVPGFRPPSTGGRPQRTHPRPTTRTAPDQIIPALRTALEGFARNPWTRAEYRASRQADGGRGPGGRY